ncbi:MAG: septum formation initiator family protein [Pisciglobus halotolerans]|nr:septum formation initiator family protein [Pisciglobus halotolerans]
MQEQKQRKITHLKNEYTQTKTEQAHKEAAKQKRRRRLIVILTISCTFIIALSVKLWSNIQLLEDIEQQATVSQKELKETKEEQNGLSKNISKLKDDDYIAKLARSQYYLSKGNEIVFSFPEDNAAQSAEKKMTGKSKDEKSEKELDEPAASNKEE